jgi:hypothetical protein
MVPINTDTVPISIALFRHHHLPTVSLPPRLRLLKTPTRSVSLSTGRNHATCLNAFRPTPTCILGHLHGVSSPAGIGIQATQNPTSLIHLGLIPKYTARPLTEVVLTLPVAWLILCTLIVRPALVLVARPPTLKRTIG